MYPEPHPGEAYLDFSDYLAPLGDWLHSREPWSPWQQGEQHCPRQPDWVALQGKRGVIVAGRIQDPAEAQRVAQLAERLGWPLLADLQSQIRFDSRNLIHMDLALQNSCFVTELARAEVLLQFGARLISKRLGQFIKQHPWQDYWLVDPQPARLDRTTGCVAAWCVRPAPSPRPIRWTTAIYPGTGWRSASRASAAKFAAPAIASQSSGYATVWPSSSRASCSSATACRPG